MYFINSKFGQTFKNIFLKYFKVFTARTFRKVLCLWFILRIKTILWIKKIKYKFQNQDLSRVRKLRYLIFFGKPMPSNVRILANLRDQVSLQDQNIFSYSCCCCCVVADVQSVSQLYISSLKTLEKFNNDSKIFG